MERLYFLLPDVAAARSIVQQLLLAGIGWKDIHLVAREGTELENLPEAALVHRSDLVAALRQGAAVGAATGALAGLLAIAFPPAGLTLAGGALLALTVAGAGFGAWVGGMIGVSMPNRRLSRFQDAMGRGQLLMMVDLSPTRVAEVEAVMRRDHPEALIERRVAAIPAFP